MKARVLRALVWLPSDLILDKIMQDFDHSESKFPKKFPISHFPVKNFPIS